MLDRPREIVRSIAALATGTSPANLDFSFMFLSYLVTAYTCATGFCKSAIAFCSTPIPSNSIEWTMELSGYGMLLMDTQFLLITLSWLLSFFGTELPLVMLMVPLAVAQYSVHVRLWAGKDGLSCETFRALVRFWIVWTLGSLPQSLMHTFAERRFYQITGLPTRERTHFVGSTLLNIVTLWCCSSYMSPLLRFAMLVSLIQYEVPVAVANILRGNGDSRSWRSAPHTTCASTCPPVAAPVRRKFPSSTDSGITRKPATPSDWNGKYSTTTTGPDEDLALLAAIEQDFAPAYPVDADGPGSIHSSTDSTLGVIRTERLDDHPSYSGSSLGSFYRYDSDDLVLNLPSSDAEADYDAGTESESGDDAAVSQTSAQEGEASGAPDNQDVIHTTEDAEESSF